MNSERPEKNAGQTFLSALQRRRLPKYLFVILLIAITATICWAQRGGGRRWRNQYAGGDRYGVPDWTNAPGFEKNAFVFARVRYNSPRWNGGGGWATDYRDADLNLSFRLQQLTAMHVDPEGKIIDLTDPELANYPFLYIVEPGSMELTEEEATALRKHLLNGGFVMFDDFWGQPEGDNLYQELKRVFPTRDPVELPPDHPIFHCVFDLKERPQIPGVRAFLSGYTYEKGGRDVHYKGIFDDKGRMMVIVCQNTDTGDGWEEEATNPDYFKEYSEKFAYPLAVNIFFYAMTH